MLLPTGIVTVSAIAPLPLAVNPLALPAPTALPVAVVLPLGNGSAIVAPVTALVPAFDTTPAQTTLLLPYTALSRSVFVTDRSALLACVSVSVAELFPEVGSGVLF